MVTTVTRTRLNVTLHVRCPGEDCEFVINLNNVAIMRYLCLASYSSTVANESQELGI
jgi:hypothetical protein